MCGCGTSYWCGGHCLCGCTHDTIDGQTKQARHFAAQYTARTNELDVRAFSAGRFNALRDASNALAALPNAPLYSTRTKGTATDGWQSALRSAVGAVDDLLNAEPDDPPNLGSSEPAIGSVVMCVGGWQAPDASAVAHRWPEGWYVAGSSHVYDWPHVSTGWDRVILLHGGEG